MNRILVLSLALVAGCSSLVDDHCARGYVRDDGTCVTRPDVDGGATGVTADARMAVENMPADPTPGPDGGIDASVDASVDASDAGVDASGAAPDAIVADAAPDAFTCTPPLTACYEMCVDLETDPDHCGSCTHQCASGICSAGHCQGEPWGHVIAIGHDYTSSHASQRRVLANAIALGASNNVGIAWWPSDTASTVHRQALATGMTAIGRAWHETAFPSAPASSFAGIDVVVVGPDTADGDNADATGAVWAAALDSFLRTGGVIVVLDGANGTNHRFAHGAQLFDVGAPVTVTGQPTAVVDGTDALAEQVIAPYLAEASSVTWPGAPQPVVTTMGGTDAIVFHLTR
ncbi:MAG: hypothetical protein AB7L94_25295 [Kofleriaceae bacterium]